MKVAIAPCVVLLLAIATIAQSNTVTHSCGAKDQADLRKLTEQWKGGYNRGDAASVAALYTADAYYLTQHFATGIVEGRTKIQAYVQKGVDAHYHIDSINLLHMDCYGSMAYAIDRYESTNAWQKAFGVNLVVLRKTGRKWMIVAHEAAVPDPAAIRSLDPPDSR